MTDTVTTRTSPIVKSRTTTSTSKSITTTTTTSCCLLFLLAFLPTASHGFSIVASTSAFHKTPTSGPVSSKLTSRTRSSTITTTTTTRTSSSELHLMAPIFDFPMVAAASSDLSHAYNFALQNYQIPTQSATAGILCGVGDVMAQVRSDDDDDDNNDSNGSQDISSQNNPKSSEEQQLNLERLSAFVVKGLGGGIIWSNWYVLNESWSDTVTLDLMQQQQEWLMIPQNYDWLIKTFVSIFFEQFVACPIVYSLWDLPVPALLKGESVEDVAVQVTQKVPGLLWENAKVWTFVNLLVYNIPIQFRVLFMSVCDVFWQSVISETVANDVVVVDDDDAATTTTSA